MSNKFKTTNMEKSISFDFWGTLMVSNPNFKTAQQKLYKEFTGNNPQIFADRRRGIKIELDALVEATGVQPKSEYFQRLLPELNLKQIKEFNSYSEELFLKNPPILREPETDIIEELRRLDYRIYISSNTIFISGNILGKVIYDNFGIVKKNCNFSDLVGVSKPSKEMFDFEIKPTSHIGDNLITDGASENFGIKHYHINKEQNFNTFLENL